MSETNNPLNDFLNMQEETPTMFGGFAFPPVIPDAVPTASAQNPSAPAQPVPQAMPQAVEQPVAYTVTPPVPQTAPQQVPQQPAASAQAPVQGSLFQAAMAQTPAGQQPAAQPAPVVQPIPQNVPAAAPAPQPAPQPALAPDPAPEIANAPDPLSAALAKAKQQGDARLVEACATRDAMFVYGKAKDPITDRDCTFEDLREKYESDFPELAESKKVEWSVTYGKETKTITNPGSDKIYDVKAEMEKSKKFIEGIKKGKSEAEKNPECIVKPRIKAQSKGEVIHLSSYKEFCSTEEEAHGSSKAIVLLPSSDGRVYQMRKTPVGTFTAQAGNLPEFPEVKPGFQMGLPKIPMHLLMFIWDFFAKLSERYELEALVHILYDMHSKEYTVRVPKQKLTHVSVDSVLDEEYPDHLIHVMDIHSHNTMPAKFSAVDDADEKPTRLYAVMGMLHRAFPDILSRVQANKISIHGNLFFIPKQFLPLLNLLEDYIAAIGEHNLNAGVVMSNSMFVVDDERQRQKMTDEFYANYKKDIELYQDRVQHFINSGCESPAVIKRWLEKINALQQKKATYEEILRRRLDDLEQDYRMLQMQGQELAVRNVKGQMTIPMAA